MEGEIRKIQDLKAQLLKIGPFHPGKITTQYIRCGKKDCRCNHPKNPQKHGPYYILSYSIGKKTSTVFLKEHEVPEAQKWLEGYHGFKNTVEALVTAYVNLAKKGRWKMAGRHA